MLERIGTDRSYIGKYIIGHNFKRDCSFCIKFIYDNLYFTIQMVAMMIIPSNNIYMQKKQFIWHTDYDDSREYQKFHI